MTYSSIFIHNYLTTSLRQPRTTLAATTTASLHLRRRFHFRPSSTPLRCPPLPRRPTLNSFSVYHRRSSAFAAKSSAGLFSSLRFKDDTIPFLNQRNSRYGRLAYDEYGSDQEDSDREVESGQLVSLQIQLFEFGQ